MVVLEYHMDPDEKRVDIDDLIDKIYSTFKKEILSPELYMENGECITVHMVITKCLCVKCLSIKYFMV